MIFLVVAEVGLQAIVHLAPIELKALDIRDLYDSLSTASLSMFAISEATGIPRETVRRKVHQLIGEGFLAVRDKDKNIHVPISALSDPSVLEILNLYVSEAESLARTIGYYGQVADRR